MSVERCEDCKAWDCGVCHRFPPVPCSNKGIVYDWRWPQTRYDDWCMEFMRRGPHESCHASKVRSATRKGRVSR